MTLKTLLINPKHSEWARTLPLGLAYVAAAAEKKGFSVDVLDLNVSDVPDLSLPHRSREADVVGITSTTPQVRESWRIAELVKSINPKCKVVLGGVHPTSLPEESLSTPHVDFVVRGEGEETFSELLQALTGDVRLESIKGLSFKTSREIIHNPDRAYIEDLDSIPFPARHLFPPPRVYRSPMLKRKLFADITTSRGCPGSCIFCNKSVFGHTFRSRSPENVVSEIEHLVDVYGVGEFHIADDTFTFDTERAMQICDLIIERKLDIVWSCSNGIRVDCVNKKLLGRMKEAGCYRVSFGVESGSDEVLKKIGKGITLQQVSDAFEASASVGLTTIAFYMIGNYGENRKSMEDTIAFAKFLKADYSQFTIAVPFPGTAMFRLIEKRGKFLTKNWDRYGIYEEPLFETEDMPKELVTEMYKKAYKEFYFRPSYVLKKVMGVRSLGDLKVGVGGFLEILRRMLMRGRGQ